MDFKSQLEKLKKENTRLTIIAKANSVPTYLYIVDGNTAREKIMESTDDCVYIPVKDEKSLRYFIDTYIEILTTNTQPGRMRPFFRMLAATDEWYLAEIELSENRKDYNF